MIGGLLALACNEGGRNRGDAQPDASAAAHRGDAARSDAGARPPDAAPTVDGALASADAGGGPADGRHRRLAVSATHACAIREAGLYCWGGNSLGELGDGTMTDSAVPVRALAVGDDVVEVAAHSGRTCVRRSTGQVACWGNNDRGQLGDGTRNNALAAVPALGIDDVVRIELDESSTCVVHGPDRGVSCWGESPAASPESGSLVPRRIAGVAGVEDLRGGSSSSYCALDSEGSVLCWRIEEGQWTVPETIAALSGSRAIAMPQADYVCAVVQTGGVVCQGIEGGLTVNLPSSQGTVALEAGSGGLVLCGVDVASRWKCWNVPSFVLAAMGDPNVAGQFAFEVTSDQPIEELAIAGFSLCVLRADRTVACLDPDSNTTLEMLAQGRFMLSSVVAGLPE